MIKQDIWAVANKMAARMEELHSDGALVLLSGWDWGALECNYDFLTYGGKELIEQSFRNMEPVIRRMEGLNANPSETSAREMGRIAADLCADADPEIDALFAQILRIIGTANGRGEAILMISWIELGIYQRRAVIMGGMVRKIAGLFNVGIDAFRKFLCVDECHGE